MRHHDFMIFGAMGVYCGLCYRNASACRCDVSFLQELTCDSADAELAARRAVVATANDRQATGTTTATACKRCGLLIYQGISHMCPDFDEPMEFVDSKRLRELEALEAAVNAHQATCPQCGAPMPGGVPAADPPSMPAPAPDANIAGEPTPSGYMSRPKML